MGKDTKGRRIARIMLTHIYIYTIFAVFKILISCLRHYFAIGVLKDFMHLAIILRFSMENPDQA